MHWPFQGPLGQFSEKSFQFAQESVGQNPVLTAEKKYWHYACINDGGLGLLERPRYCHS